MPESKRRPRSVATAAETLVDAMREGGNATAAAALLGISKTTFYGRMRRAGLSTRDIQHQVAREFGTPTLPKVTPGDVTYAGDVVQMTLADYALLRAQATVWQAELDKANRIIARLVDETKGCKCR